VDVTEEKRMRKEAEYHLQQIVQADKMASFEEVVAGAAHGLPTSCLPATLRHTPRQTRS